MPTYTTIGKSVARVDGLVKVSGAACYSADIFLPGMLWGKALRSPLPHARILHIDTSKAQRIAGVHAVLTAADLPDVRVGRGMRDMPILARDKVRFVGEKVAAVAATDRNTAEEALLLIDVEYEELPAVFDPVEALQPGAPILHEGINDYAGLPEPIQEPTNLFSHRVWARGDIQQGFARADTVFEHSFAVPSVHQGYIEPHACVVQLDGSGRVQIWTSTKTPLRLRSDLARAVELEPEQIRVNVTYLGGDFGGKGGCMDEPLAYFLARATGRPVKMVMSYTEELMAGDPRHSATITIRSGIQRVGILTAREGKVVFNSGAYAAFKPGVNLAGAVSLAGSYRIPHVRIESDCVYTNTVPCGHMRAPGAPQTVFAVESHMDMIAKEMGIDPLEIRLRNVYREGDQNLAGKTLVHVQGELTLRRAAEAFGRGTFKQGPWAGRGIALYDRHTGSGESSATVVANGDGTITVKSPVFDVGTGTHTVLCQIVAEELTLPLEAVNVLTVDTDSGLSDEGVGSSRVTHSAGQATLQAAKQLRQHLTGVAAELLGAPEERVRLERGRFTVQGGSGKSMALGEVASSIARSQGPPSAQATYIPVDLPAVTSFCAQIAEVEIDPETGRVEVRRFISAHDVGTMLNPLTHQGQIEGGIVQGLGYALTEDLKVEQGQVRALSLLDFRVPTAMDVPELITVLVEKSPGPAPYQGKAIGEMSTPAAAAAVANAVADAIGVHIASLPITGEKVLEALKASKRTPRA